MISSFLFKFDDGWMTQVFGEYWSFNIYTSEILTFECVFEFFFDGLRSF